MSVLVAVTKSDFGEVVLPVHGHTKISKYTLDNGFMSVDLINYGATVIAVNVPNSKGNNGNVVIGYESIVDYLNRRNPYMGATVGRYGHRITGGILAYNDQKYYLSKNDGDHTYHGGVQGFDKKVWNSTIEDNTVLMTYKSYDLEEGFPGDLFVSARFILTNRNQFIIVYRATPSNMTTPVNIMNQLYFNLSSGIKSEITNHKVKIFSEYKAVVQENEPCSPTGGTEEIAGSPYDLIEYTPISSIITGTKTESTLGNVKSDKKANDGIDVSSGTVKKTTEGKKPDDTTELNLSILTNDGVFYCIEGLGVRPHANKMGFHNITAEKLEYSSLPCISMLRTTKLKHEKSGRSVQVFSDQPCLLLYIGKDLEGRSAESRENSLNDGILIQPGNFPDAVHLDKFPSPWVPPKKTYQHTILYKFRVSGLDCSDEEDGLPRAPKETKEERRMKCFTIEPEGPNDPE